MIGQKQIIQCLIVVLLIFTLNYYKSVIRREKEIQKALKLKKAAQEKENADPSAAIETSDALNENVPDSVQVLGSGLDLDPRHSSNQCVRDEHRIFSDFNRKPICLPTTRASNKYIKRSDQREEHSHSASSDKNKQFSERNNENEYLINNKSNSTKSNIVHSVSDSDNSCEDGVNSGSNKKISSSKVGNSQGETSKALTYIFATILLASFIKAVLDVSKHIREVSVQLLRRNYVFGKSKQIISFSHSPRFVAKAEENYGGKRTNAALFVAGLLASEEKPGKQTEECTQNHRINSSVVCG